MEQRILRLIDRIKAHLNQTYGDGIKRVILYGSYARGEATKDSDVDVLVLIGPALKPSEVRENLSDLLYDIIMEEGELISVMVISEEYFENHNFPFMLNVRKEGVPV
jgi:predicted nucleotidyltransferase